MTRLAAPQPPSALDCFCAGRSRHCVSQACVSGCACIKAAAGRIQPATLATHRSATVKRLAFGVGTGDWDDTEVMPDAVTVTTKLVLRPKG